MYNNVKETRNINDNDIDDKIFATTLIVSGVILMNNMDAYKKVCDEFGISTTLARLQEHEGVTG